MEAIEFISKKNGPHLCNNEAVLSTRKGERERRSLHKVAAITFYISAGSK